MGMKLRNYHGSIVKTHLTYEVFREDGSKLCQCGTLEDAEMLVGFDTSRYWVALELPPPPQTINVTFTEGEREKQLNPQNILPDKQQEPLEL